MQLKKNAVEHWKYSYDYNHLQMKQIFALNNPEGVDIPLNNPEGSPHSVIGKVLDCGPKVSEFEF